MDVDRLVENIRKTHEEKQEEAERLRDALSTVQFTGAHEEQFIRSVTAERPDPFTAAAVDGGLVRKEYHGLDLIIRRAVAAVFQYSDGELANADYRPSRSPDPAIEPVTDGRSREESNRLASLLRLEAEVGAALEAVEDADLLMLDGSLLPQMRDRPGEGSLLTDRYEELLERYRTLYQTAEENGTLVAGVVEDSRGSRMCTLLRENGVGEGFADGERDSVVLTHLLAAGERTLSAPYTGSNAPILQDMGLGDSFHVFYLRTVEKDRPVRIEFYAPDDPAERGETIASRISSLCGSGSSYGIPPVLVEADRRATLGGGDVELLTKRIETKLAHLPGLQGLRRDRRPF